MRSCQIPVSQAAGTRVLTIEGLSSDGVHPLQRAWIAEQVPQCGYCQAGMMTFGAYLPKSVSIMRCAIIIIVADTLVALIAGLIV